MRLVADRLLQPDESGVRHPTYIKGELGQQKLKLSPPKASATRRHHVYVSPHVVGGEALMEELGVRVGCRILTSSVPEELTACNHFLVYLHAKTWTSGAQSKAFAREVERAMSAGISLLLAHEMVHATPLLTL